MLPDPLGLGDPLGLVDQRRRGHPLTVLAVQLDFLTVYLAMKVLELESAFEKLSPCEQEEFASWLERRAAAAGPSTDLAVVWAEEAERRLGELRSGTVQPIPGDQVMDELRRRFAR
jgi:putative addiction module component (TIGR02574 family)